MVISTIAIVFIIFLKYAVPVGIIFFPFIAGWVNFVLDTVDGDLLIPLGLSDQAYQLIDKTADWATYVGMAISAWRFRWIIRRWIYFLFGLRTIGQAGFLLFRDEKIFFYFPNFLEPFFLIFATIVFFKKSQAEKFYLKHKIAIWIFVFIYKMQDEWITHIANIDRSDIIRNLFR